MIEEWCGRGWSKLNPAAGKAAARMKRVRPGVWILALVMLVVGARKLQRFYHGHSGYRDEIAAAIGSIGFFYGPPQPDQSGSRVLYLRTSETGLALFRREVATGKTTLLNEWLAAGIEGLSGQKLLPLSPDDRLFALASKSAGRSRGLAICEVDSGKELARIDAPEWIVTESAWLTPDRLAWLRRKPLVAGAPSVFELHLTERQRDGSWADARAPVALTNVSCLAGLSEDTIAWMDRNGVCAMRPVSNTTTVLFRTEGKQISEISYCRKTRQFLVTCREKGGYSVWRLQVKTNAPNDFTQLTSDKNVRSAQWINDGRGYAYLNQNALVMAADAAGKAVQLGQATVDTLVAAPTGDGLFFIGALGREAGLGLWHYAVNSQALTNVVCYSDAPSSHATCVQPVRCVTRAGAGEPLNYYVYWPANFNRHKKYPLLIGDTFFRTYVYQGDMDGPSWAEAMANCGAYVVVIDRKAWFLENNEEWGRDVMAVYSQLKNDPTVDSGEVFLYAASVESSYLSKLLEERPQFWKGAVLLNPIGLPEFSAIRPGRRLPKILISAGTEEHESERFTKYREAASGRGMLVEVVEHANSAHILVSIPALRGRIRAMKDFVFEQ